jgi:hypothetical protein
LSESDVGEEASERNDGVGPDEISISEGIR